MKLFTVAVAAVLVVSSLESPSTVQSRKRRNEGRDEEEQGKQQQAEEVVESLSSLLCDYSDDNENLRSKCVSIFRKPMKAFAKAFVAMLFPTSDPTDDEITKMAKEFSRSLKEIPLETAHELIYNRRVSSIDKENVDHLKEVMSFTAIQNIDELVAQLKQKDIHLYCAVDETGQFEDTGIQALANCQHHNFAHGIVTDYKFKAVFELFRNEENALEVARNFAVLMHAVKQPSSYESADAFLNALMKTPFWNAVATIYKQTKQCFSEDLLGPGALEGLKNAWGESMFWESEFPPLIRMALNPSDLLGIAIMIQTDVDEEPSRLFQQCVLPDEERKIYEEIALQHDPLMTSEKLLDIMNRNRKAREVLYILNRIVLLIRRKDDLSEPARTFYEKMVTVPNLLLLEEDMVAPSESVLARRAEVKAELTKQLNKLTPETRKELAERFPADILSLLKHLK